VLAAFGCDTNHDAHQIIDYVITITNVERNARKHWEENMKGLFGLIGKENNVKGK